MTYSVVFKFKEHGRFPEERTVNEMIVVEKNESVLIPQVGDQITCHYDGRPIDFKVLSRHFNYLDHRCTVDIEVGHPDVHEGLSLKE